MRKGVVPVILLALLAACVCSNGAESEMSKRREEYIREVTRGAGFLSWQEQGLSEEEKAFREKTEERKNEMLAGRTSVRYPAMLSIEDLARARRNIENTPWGKVWFEDQKEIADFIVEKPDGYVEYMIPELSPGHVYGFTCPNCAGRLSQEGVGNSIIEWDHGEPDVIRCGRCGHIYPSDEYPETAVLACPRMGQTFTYYLNEEERENPGDHTGRLAYHWVGHPMHVSFSGVIRYKKAAFMLDGARRLALVYALTGKRRYAERAAEILVRFAECYCNWLYSDYWDTRADCDPMYAAWHDHDLRLEWKRHPCENAFDNDGMEKASMLQSYWGAGRFHPSTDAIWSLPSVCVAYDLVRRAEDVDHRPLWTPEMRQKVEKDLILEWVIGAEPFVGGEGKAASVNNKAPRVYNAQAAVAVVLGIPDLADTALRGYEAIRDKSFLFDGFSRESPAYTNMYLSQLLQVPETLHGFRWPELFEKRKGTVDVYSSDPRLHLMLRAVLDQLRPDGRYLPLGDTNVESSPSPHICALGLRRYPEYHAGTLPTILRDRSPGNYSVFHLDAETLERDDVFIPPEILFPAWMTAILRHGSGADASLLSLTFSPPGGHRHADNLALFYVDRGDTILGDHGYVGDMPVNGWIKATESHNLVIVDDEKQRFGGNSGPRRPRLSFMAVSPKASVVEASSEVYAQCREYRRLVTLIKGPGAQTFAVDIFRVRGGSKHDYRVFSELASSHEKDGALEFHGLDMPPEAPFPDIGGSLAQEDIFGLRDVRKTTVPPSNWQAVWKEPERRYRLWMLTESDEVRASNGPGQETRTQLGRRVRYVDVIREGKNLSSTFVAVHEPSGQDGFMPIREVQRLAVPEGAGPDAVALRIVSDWGAYVVLNEFLHEAKLEDLRFEGRLGIIAEGPAGERWMLASGARTLEKGDFGFAGRPQIWSGMIEKNSEAILTPATERPKGWPEPAGLCRNYVVVKTDESVTGFPVRETSRQSITVERFPLPPVREFELPALIYLGR